MKNGKLLSVIIPVFNTSNTLNACLQSVLTQDYQNLEILCVDDGSVDNSLKILEKYASNDSRIRILRHEKNRGLLNARRTGTEEAQGDFIQYVDSDDTIDRELFSSVMDAIQTENSDIVQFSGRQIYLNTNKKFTIEPPVGKYMGEQILENFFVTRKVTTSLVLKIYRAEICKKAFEKIPDFHCYVGEDILTSFFIAFFSSSYLGIKTKAKYNYAFGSGISSENEMSLKKYQLYCQMNKFPGIIESFLEKNHSNPMGDRALEYMTCRLISDCLNEYIFVNSDEKEEAGKIFWTCWNESPFFLKTILNVVENQEKLINDIKNSESYKIGNAIVNPLHNLKNVLTSH